LLMELRKFREQYPEIFRRIHNLPLRARVGRSCTLTLLLLKRNQNLPSLSLAHMLDQQFE
jgi:hypothetical protein